MNTQSETELLERFNNPDAHHPLGPSGASRWMACPASLRMTIDLPPSMSDAAEEGTRAHAEAEKCLNNNAPAKEYDIQPYLDLVRALGGKLWVEQVIKLDPYIPGGYGTADAIVLDGEHLHLVDLKYGKGVKVDAKENPQLMIYAAGAFDALARHYTITKVTVHICQPRLDHIDSWTVSPDDLLYFSESVYQASRRCLEPSPEFSPSDKACQWCRASSTCPALYQHSLAVVGDDFSPVPADTLTPEQIALVLDNKALIESWLRSVEAHAFSLIEHGTSVPGYKAVAGRSQRKYKTDAADKLQEILGDDAFDKKLKGITTLEKMLGKKHFAELDLTDKPEGKPVMVKEDDPRKSLQLTLADFD